MGVVWREGIGKSDVLLAAGVAPLVRDAPSRRVESAGRHALAEQGGVCRTVEAGGGRSMALLALPASWPAPGGRGSSLETWPNRPPKTTGGTLRGIDRCAIQREVAAGQAKAGCGWAQHARRCMYIRTPGTSTVGRRLGRAGPRPPPGTEEGAACLSCCPPGHLANAHTTSLSSGKVQSCVGARMGKRPASRTG